jgi:hypothetical protein
MNLHKIVAGSIATVNPHQRAVLEISTGYTTNADGSRVPSYANPIIVTAQVQFLSEAELQHLASLNIQGSTRSIYLSGELNAVQRLTQVGGDLITLGDGTLWLTTAVMEQWPDWCKVSVVMQTTRNIRRTA